MPNFKHLVIVGLCLTVGLAGATWQSPAMAQQGDAATSSLQLLPNTMGGLVRVVDYPAAAQAWQNTSLAALADDPAMEPFWEAQRAAAEEELLEAGLRVGVRWGDLQSIASGEVLAGWLTFSDPRRPYAVMLVTDITGRHQQAEDVLARIDAAMQQREAKRNDVNYRDETIRVYTLPRARGEIQIDHIAIALTQQRLIASDRQVVVEQLLDAVAGQPPEQQLVEADDWEQVMERVGEPQPSEVQWFARPLPFARIMREVAGTDRGDRVDIVQLLENQGFDAVQAGGGRVQIAEAEYDLLHRGFIFAPKPTGQSERFRLAARMLQFPNVPLQPLPQWIGADAATCLRLNWKMEEAFWAAETLVDEAFGDDIFRPTLEGIREDPEGPQIDIPNNVIANFDEQMILVTDNVQPAAADSERMLVAVRLANAAPVAQAVRKAMESEPDATRLEALPNHPAWKVVPREEPIDFEEDLFNDFGFEPDTVPQEDQPAPLLEQWAITVVEGPDEDGEGTVAYLMFSSHAEMLVDAVRRIQNPQIEGGFASQAEVQTVLEKVAQLGGDTRSIERINVLSRSWRTKYQLMREGKLRESDSVLASLLRRLTEGDAPAEQPETRGVDQLPPFETIQKYLHPSGSFTHTEPDGWTLFGFLLGEAAVEE